MRLQNKIFCAILPIALAFSCALKASSEEFQGKVVGVSDGDTISVFVHGETRKIRLSGIDCPEKSQEFGQQAKAFTSKEAFSKEVTIISHGHDRYKRTLGEVILPGGENLNNLLLSHGYAWFYERFSSDEEKRKLESSARQAKLGLWSQHLPNAPWDFRKQQKAKS